MKDFFSGHASEYAAFRPGYPAALYNALLQQVAGRHHAWDVGCGNGQVARDLAPHFVQVTATDISAKQIQQAAPVDNLEYHVCPAEQTPFASNSFDLITVAQALHWFNIPTFFQEAQRVAKPGALVALWGYNLLKVDVYMDDLLQEFYVRMGPYWDAARKLVDDQYRSIGFPFAEVQMPPFSMTYRWTLDHFQGYLSTWSAVKQYIHVHGQNPVDELAGALVPYWVGPREVVFPIFLRAGRIEKSV